MPDVRPVVRPAAVAGTFYPAHAGALTRAVEACLADVAAPIAAIPAPASALSPWPKALIVPHAGYVYSGPIAASAYARLVPARGNVRRVVLFGPAHRVALRGLAVPMATAFATPLGSVPVDADALAALADLPYVVTSEAVHADEHSLEVQLPFLQAILGQFSIVPFAVGAASGEEVATVMDRLWGGPETLLLVSSDLSHYHPYAAARRLDQCTADAVLALDPDLDHEQACGATPINGLLRCVAARGLVPTLLDLRNSGDTAGDRSRVVGYAAFAFDEVTLHG
ncbi:MAG: AmmeMemoRadiSam system protein B [Casimicrobiaceae bacterium]